MVYVHNRLLYNTNILQYVSGFPFHLRLGVHGLHPVTTQTLTIIIIIFVSVLQITKQKTDCFIYIQCSIE